MYTDKSVFQQEFKKCSAVYFFFNVLASKRFLKTVIKSLGYASFINEKNQFKSPRHCRIRVACAPLPTSVWGRPQTGLVHSSTDILSRYFLSILKSRQPSWSDRSDAPRRL
uniref:Uncharacterized protein n=1 Tax=Anguilla anguilla TaxID=7936 RepID=A0A0E9XT53_ANGAN